MFRRRRRRFNGRWFPTVTTGNGFVTTATRGVGSPPESKDIIPVIADSLDLPANILTVGVASAPLPLAAAVGPGNSYLIKRIVGDIDISLEQNAEDDSHAFVGLSFFVDRVDNAGALQNIAAWQFFETGNGVGVLATLKRWLFRRMFHLGNSASTVIGADKVFPPYSTGWIANGMMSGGHIDIRGKARVSPQERLFMGIHLLTGSAGVAEGISSTVQVSHNLRLFAKPTLYDNR